jgi:hypothetical protein
MDPKQVLDGQPAATNARRPYRTPEVRRLGSVRDLTLGGGALSFNDSGGTKAKVAPLGV